jgi:hypothetical protein
MGHWENNGKTDEWYTPKYIFDALGVEFDLDVASPIDRSLCHVPAKDFITENSLDISWSGFAWCNPPFGGRNGISPWLEKMKVHGNGIALSPDRSSTTWWQDAARSADAILFVHRKIKFISNHGYIGTKPGNGTTLFAYGSKAVEALRNAESKGLGIFFLSTPSVTESPKQL